MKEKIVEVRRAKKEAGLFLGIFVVCLLGIVFLAIRFHPAFLYFSGMLLLPVPFLIDYRAWRITLNGDTITVKNLVSARTYPYSGVAYAKEYLSAGQNGWTILIRFSDGRTAAFCEREQGFYDARKLLIRHTLFLPEEEMFDDPFIDWGAATAHSARSMEARGVTREMAEEWISGGRPLELPGHKILYITEQGAVVAEPGDADREIPGRVITAFTSREYNDFLRSAAKRMFRKGGNK